MRGRCWGSAEEIVCSQIVYALWDTLKKVHRAYQKSPISVMAAAHK